ncbi:MAG TPA: TonB family protein [Gemmatimonadaceae bacterium]|nr:TonB family protein [Gemmatimonadaceae bacterium]
MFTTLIESKPKKDRRPAGTIASVVLHLGILVLAVAATANARIESEKAREEKLNYVEVKKEEIKQEEPKPKEPEPPKPKKPEPVKKAPTPPKAPPAPRVEAPAPPKGFQVVQAPINVPVSIPKVDLSAAMTNEADFSGKGVAGGTSKGVTGGTGDADSKGTQAGPTLSTQPYLEFQVEEAASPSGGNPSPQYPSSERQTGVTGRVVVQFVVAANGRVEPGSIKILQSTNSAFAAAVRDVLPRHRFSPAKIGGRPVRQVVQQPFVFKLNS